MRKTKGIGNCLITIIRTVEHLWNMKSCVQKIWRDKANRMITSQRKQLFHGIQCVTPGIFDCSSFKGIRRVVQVMWQNWQSIEKEFKRIFLGGRLRGFWWKKWRDFYEGEAVLRMKLSRFCKKTAMLPCISWGKIKGDLKLTWTENNSCREEEQRSKEEDWSERTRRVQRWMSTERNAAVVMVSSAFN